MTPATMTDAEIIVSKLGQLGVPCEIAAIHEAPQVVRYEIAPGEGTKAIDYRRLSRADDLAMALGAESVVIQTPIPGSNHIGIEIARKDRQTISATELTPARYPLEIPLGVDTNGQELVLDLTKAPHALVAGETGSGKSILLNVILWQLLATHGPEALSLVLIDPKRVEFDCYQGLPHLAAPVADTPQEAIRQLEGMVNNMEIRYGILKDLSVRDIDEANRLIRAEGYPEMARVVIVADEIADLMMTSRKEVETLFVRLAQKGRAAGIHLVLATQYPTRDVITGLLRVNLPTKIAMRVSDKTASRVICDRNGTELLLGSGDALFSFGGRPPIRFQSAYVTSDEIRERVEGWL